jgi:hypothetical protein
MLGLLVAAAATASPPALNSADKWTLHCHTVQGVAFRLQGGTYIPSTLNPEDYTVVKSPSNICRPDSEHISKQTYGMAFASICLNVRTSDLTYGPDNSVNCMEIDYFDNGVWKVKVQCRSDDLFMTAAPDGRFEIGRLNGDVIDPPRLVRDDYMEVGRCTRTPD